MTVEMRRDGAAPTDARLVRFADDHGNALLVGRTDGGYLSLVGARTVRVDSDEVPVVTSGVWDDRAELEALRDAIAEVLDRWEQPPPPPRARVVLPERSVFESSHDDRPVNSDAREATLVGPGAGDTGWVLEFEISARDLSALALGSTYGVPLTADEAAALERVPS